MGLEIFAFRYGKINKISTRSLHHVGFDIDLTMTQSLVTTEFAWLKKLADFPNSTCRDEEEANSRDCHCMKHGIRQ